MEQYSPNQPEWGQELYHRAFLRVFYVWDKQARSLDSVSAARHPAELKYNINPQWMRSRSGDWHRQSSSCPDTRRKPKQFLRQNEWTMLLDREKQYMCCVTKDAAGCVCLSKDETRIVALESVMICGVSDGFYCERPHDSSCATYHGHPVSSRHRIVVPIDQTKPIIGAQVQDQRRSIFWWTIEPKITNGNPLDVFNWAGGSGSNCQTNGTNSVSKFDAATISDEGNVEMILQYCSIIFDQ